VSGAGLDRITLTDDLIGTVSSGTVYRYNQRNSIQKTKITIMNHLS
jgi:hypothetical protein